MVNVPQRFYAGGFLYNSKTKQILLHKRDEHAAVNPNNWAFFGGLSEPGEEPVDTFIRELREELDVTIEKLHVCPLRDYLNSELNTHRFVFYALSDLKKEDMRLDEGEDFGWFSLGEALKMVITKYTREDLLYFRDKLFSYR